MDKGSEDREVIWLDYKDWKMEVKEDDFEKIQLLRTKMEA